MDNDKSIRISQISTGFSEIPGQISINIFAQGCKLNCSGCQNPELKNFDSGTVLNTTDIGVIIENHKLSDWICWLGGDITFQPQFVHFNKIFKDMGFKVCLYTGQLFETISELLDDVDLVIDGPWEGKKVSDNDTNQRIFIKNINWKQINWNDIKGELKC